MRRAVPAKPQPLGLYFRPGSTEHSGVLAVLESGRSGFFGARARVDKFLGIAMNAIARKLDAIREKGRMGAVDVANFLNIRPETVSRWKQGKAFPRPEAQKRLMELEYIVDQLSDIYSPDEARLWLYSRQKLLSGDIPAALIQSGRTDEVLAVIDQLREGVFI